MAIAFFLVAVLATCVCHADANGAQYPAGVNPQSCPNYPNCDNAVLHGGAHSGAGAWGAPVAPAPANAWGGAATPAWNSPAAPAVATQYPAGVNPQSCPNYPNCDNAALHGRAPAASHAPAWGASGWGAPVEEWSEDWNPAPAAATGGGPQYPAGVNPNSCPNYPYC